MIFVGIVIGILLVAALLAVFFVGVYIGEEREINLRKVHAYVNGKKEFLPRDCYEDFNSKYVDFVEDYFGKIDWNTIWDEKEKQNE